MISIVFMVTESGKFKGIFTQAGLDLYLSTFSTPIEFTEWKWDEAKPYDRVCEGFVTNNRRGRDTTPILRVVKTMVDGWVF